MDTLSATKAREQIYNLIDKVAESHEPLLITGKRNSVVLIGAEDWRAIQETLILVSMTLLEAQPFSTSTSL